jgi:hypothetical protein
MQEFPTRVQQTYSGADQDESARLFAADIGRAAASGYRVASQEWQGVSLTVTYELGAVAGIAAAAPQATPVAAGTAPALAPALLATPGALFTTPGMPLQAGAGLPKAAWTPSSIAIIAGGVLLVLGAFLPWASVTAFGVVQSVSGLQGIEGVLTILLGAAIIASGAGIAMAWRPGLWRAAIVLAVISVLFIAYEMADIQTKLTALTATTNGAGDIFNGIGSGLGNGLGDGLGTGLGAALGDALAVKATAGVGLLVALVGAILATVSALLAGGLRARMATRR